MTVAAAQLLTRDGWLGHQPTAFQAALLDIVIWRHVEAGTTINYAGDADGGIWGVAQGQLDMISAVSAVDSPVADIHLPGSWGGMAPLLGRTRVSNGTARIPTLMAVVPLSRLQQLLGQHPEWWECIAQLAMDFAVHYGGATGDLLIRDSRQRCIAVLLRLADCRHVDRAMPPTIIISHGDLAAASNMSRHPAGEVLRELDALGHIDLGYRQVTILDALALRAIADG